MRPLLSLIGLLALLIMSAPAMAATSASPPANTIQVAPHTVQVQQIHPVLIGLCQPAPGPGNVVAIAGVPNFQAKSVAFDTNATMTNTSSGMTSERVAHGFITITKTVDAASPKLFQMVHQSTLIPTVTITMRKAGGDPNSSYAVWTLSHASIVRVNALRTGPTNSVSDTTESVVLEYQGIKTCSPQPAGR